MRHYTYNITFESNEVLYHIALLIYFVNRTTILSNISVTFVMASCPTIVCSFYLTNQF